ncbi:Lrp/AsnC family transcriptional regulator [Kurthia massiliensis]|uniref:Lrp/AsnC family transcriptional regulator n=1 Tax=Kurthia massiliensis TaxID=1033739 RepID=UPI000288BAE9|nr:Lrp/AsnC family transcriptional regulator [Kurthia massiliensis]
MKEKVLLDDIDTKIVALLNEDGRMSYTDLSKAVNLSRVAVQARVQHLMEQGVIERFSAVINPEKMGLQVSAFFNVEVAPKYLQQVADTLAEDPNVSSLYHMTGPSKLHMHGLFKNNQDMELFLEQRLYPLPGIMSVDSQILIKRYKSRIGMKL